MQKRDFYTKRNSDLHLLFFLRPFKEFCWWIIYFLKFYIFHLNRGLFLTLRRQFLKRKKSYARTVKDARSYAFSDKPFYEIQIKHNTRDCNIFRENE